MVSKKLQILGKPWRVEYRRIEDDKYLKQGADGYCDESIRLIVLGVDIEGEIGDMARYCRKVARHEVIHAYLFESGMAECSLSVEAWARNEEMVDWFARMGPDIVDTWETLGVEGD